MRKRHSARGEGRVGLMISLIVVGVLIFVGVKVIPVRVAAYEFRDILREEARHGAVRSDDRTIAKRIMERAEELELPLQRKNLTVKRTASEMVVTAAYEHPIDLKLTTYVYKFQAQEKAPLF